MAQMRNETPERKEGGQLSAQRSEQTGIRSPGEAAWQRTWPSTPFGLMRRMFDDMDRLFSGFGSGGELGSLTRSSSGLWSPQVEMFERDNQLIVRADLPGLSKEDIELDLRDDTLTLRGERREQHEKFQEGYSYSERSYGSFSRQIPLPPGISVDQVNASFENGVLEVQMQLPEESRSQHRKIEIRSGASGEKSLGQGGSSKGKAPPQDQPVK